MAVINIVQAVNQALREEMRRDDRMIILGEDVGKDGGVFRATEGLYDEFGQDRVIHTPLAESGNDRYGNRDGCLRAESRSESNSSISFILLSIKS